MSDGPTGAEVGMNQIDVKNRYFTSFLSPEMIKLFEAPEAPIMGVALTVIDALNSQDPKVIRGVVQRTIAKMTSVAGSGLTEQTRALAQIGNVDTITTWPVETSAVYTDRDALALVSSYVQYATESEDGSAAKLLEAALGDALNGRRSAPEYSRIQEVVVGISGEIKNKLPKLFPETTQVPGGFGKPPDGLGYK